MKPIMDYQNWYEETPNEHDDNHVRWNNEWVYHSVVLWIGVARSYICADWCSPPSQVKCHPWPEKNGLDGNVWEKVEWGPPYIGFGAWVYQDEVRYGSGKWSPMMETKSKRSRARASSSIIKRFCTIFQLKRQVHLDGIRSMSCWSLSAVQVVGSQLPDIWSSISLAWS